MRFSEIASRVTGFSTPIFGVSWTPPEPDVRIARAVILFLEDKRVLYDPLEVEVEQYCIQSVLSIRQFLTDTLSRQEQGAELTDHLRAMRAACRGFLGSVGWSKDSESWHTLSRSVNLRDLYHALGELRATFGLHIAHIAVKYGLDIEPPLDATLPPDPNTDDD
jgi:hypothetical protein